MSIANAAPSLSFASRAGRRVGRHNGIAIACGVVLAVMAVAALFAPLIAPQNPYSINLLSAYQGSSSSHLLGTDALGRDLLSRLIYGARTSLLGPLLVVLCASCIGTTIAITSAWCGGAVDSLVSRALDIIFAFPGLLLAILVVAVFGVGFIAPVIALAIAYIPYIARVVRSGALRERHLVYVEAATIQGLSAWAICRRHLLPNLLPLVIAQTTIFFGYAMVDLAAISFLGLGVQPPTADWGAMVADGQASILRGYPQESLFAGGLIVLAVICFVLIGERISERWEGP